jgi:hypothetical protein
MLATFLVHLIILDFIILIIFGEEYELQCLDYEVKIGTFGERHAVFRWRYFSLHGVTFSSE